MTSAPSGFNLRGGLGAAVVLIGLLFIGGLQAASADELRIVGDISIGGSAYDQLADLAVLPDGAVIAVGATFLEGPLRLKGWAVKVSPDRTVAWELVFLEHPRSRLRAIAPLDDGTVLVAGTYWPDASRPSHAFVARLDSDGRPVWEKAYGGPGDDEGFALAALGDGGAVVAGFSTHAETGDPVAWAFRIDADGDQIWETTIDAELVAGVAVLTDGDIALAGAARRGGNAPDLWLARVAPDGTVRWQKNYGGGAHDSANAVIATPDNGMIVAGETLSRGSGGADAWLLRIDVDGAPVWDRTFGGAATDRFMAIDLLSDDRIAAAGTTQIAGTHDFELWAAVLDATGVPIATAVIGGNRDDRGLGVAATGDRGIVVSGMAQPAGSAQLVANGRILFLELP